jgi:hypothetical protein
MTEWWSYGLADFLMFSPPVYWRLVQRYNEAWWPGQLLATGAALALPLLLRTGRVAAQRLALLLLAAAWAWVGWAFHWQRYTEIFLGAPWLAALAVVEAVLLAGMAFLQPAPAGHAAHGIAWGLLAAALLYPLLAPLTGHAWSEAEVFGFMTDPTALGTLGAVAALRGWPAWSRVTLAALPMLSLLLGLATRWLIAR